MWFSNPSLFANNATGKLTTESLLLYLNKLKSRGKSEELSKICNERVYAYIVYCRVLYFQFCDKIISPAKSNEEFDNFCNNLEDYFGDETQPNENTAKLIKDIRNTAEKHKTLGLGNWKRPLVWGTHHLRFDSWFLPSRTVDFSKWFSNSDQTIGRNNVIIRSGWSSVLILFSSNLLIYQTRVLQQNSPPSYISLSSSISQSFLIHCVLFGWFVYVRHITRRRFCSDCGCNNEYCAHTARVRTNTLARAKKLKIFIQLIVIRFVCLDVWIREVATVLATPSQSTRFGLCLPVFCQTGPPHPGIHCLALLGNMCKESFPRTQRRIACSGIELGASNLPLTNPTLYRLSNCRSKIHL